MPDNKKTEIFPVVLTTLSTFWTSYKRQVRRRNETPSQTFWNDLFGAQATDTEAATELSKDLGKIVNNVRGKRTDRKFKDIIENSY
jgi:hypothetical protein